jgi:hypothetical protein
VLFISCNIICHLLVYCQHNFTYINHSALLGQLLLPSSPLVVILRLSGLSLFKFWYDLCVLRYQYHCSSVHFCDILPSPWELGYLSGIALGYELVNWGFKSQQGLGTLLFIYTGSGAHPAYYPICSRGSFPGGKAAGVRS